MEPNEHTPYSTKKSAPPAKALVAQNSHGTDVQQRLGFHAPENPSNAA
jgi:hypothetical protein